MRSHSLCLACAVIIAQVSGRLLDTKRLARTGTIPVVPSFNITMPLNHFDSSDTRTFPNRYYVNDTYYAPGGPVILFDAGEGGVTAGMAAAYLAGYGATISSSLELAKATNGLAIMWEHRYFGTSHPFPLTTMDRNDTIGIPIGGIKDYAYLTFEQALEDIVYFANHFNTTNFASDNTHLQGSAGTSGLGPYQTPWVMIGGSYPGARAAWMRIRNPEIIFASWASSATVELVLNMASYTNSIYRALPTNCTADVQAVVRYMDSIFTSNDKSTIDQLKAGILTATSGGDTTVSQISQEVAEASNAAVMAYLSAYSIEQAQELGYTNGVQYFCDLLESFSIDNTSSKGNQSNFDAVPTTKGVVASHGGASSEDALKLGTSAYLAALEQFVSVLGTGFRSQNASFSRHSPPAGEDDQYDADGTSEDQHSWSWLILREFGGIQDTNTSSPLFLTSSLVDFNEVYHDEVLSQFPEDTPGAADIPSTPNISYGNSFGGWNMKPSNTMFTNGEFDPWRALSVESLDTDLGAPTRKLTQTPPKCGQPPSGTDVFGIVFAGGTHAEDMGHFNGSYVGSQDFDDVPVQQASRLFIQAYRSWVTCFEAQKGTAGTGTGSGNGNGTSGGDGGSGNVDGNGSGNGNGNGTGDTSPSKNVASSTSISGQATFALVLAVVVTGLLW